jgi:tRNA dimethylallyltransferase
VSAVVALLGATGTGKSALALAVAEAVGAEIVNADAFQLYRGLDVGTAKPDAEARRRVPHHLLDVLEPAERTSAGEFARRARAALAGIAGRGRPALIVGGSGLYLRALLEGLAELPPADESVRAELSARLAAEGLPALRAQLERLDPASAQRIAARDTQRTLRALEVALASGRPLSAWLAESSAPAGVRASKFGLTLPRAVLYDRLEARVLEMIARGWPDEVERLLASGTPPDAPAFRAIGYGDWVRHLRGRTTYEETVARIVSVTRKYAKRQETWFRRESGVAWLDAAEPERAAAAVRERLAAERRGEG